MPKTEHTKREGDAVYIHPKAAWEKLRMAGKTRQNVYIYGATGYGKTELLRRYLRRRKHTWLNAGELTAQQLQELELPRGVIVVIDDLALVHAPDVQAEILRLVETPNVWLLMAGRCPLPHWLSPMYMNCRLTIIPEEDLALTKETLSELYLAWGIQMPRKILEEILYPLTEGNPVGARILAMEMSHGARYTPELLEKLVDNFWAYLDRTVYNRWDDSIRDLVVQMAVMGSFTIPQAEELTGAENVVQVLQQARETGNLFRIRGGVYTMRPSFQNSMIWRLKHTYSRERRNALYDRAGHIYTRAGDIPRALAMFEASGNQQKIRELLVRNVQQENGGYYYELSRYYLALPEEEVLASPDLMAALSMVCSVRLDAAGSERWYQALVRYAEQAEGDAKKRAMENQIYLDIELPHRGSSKMVEILQRSAKMAEQEHLYLGNIRVTDGIPSLLNGGKDFCFWVKDDREVAGQIARPLETLLGSKSRGMMELVQAESMFEKAEDDAKALELANRGMMETMASGKFELQFVGAAVVARLYLVSGHIDDAYRTLEEIELRARPSDRAKRSRHAVPGHALAGSAGRGRTLDGSGACGRSDLQQSGSVLLPDPGPGLYGEGTVRPCHHAADPSDAVRRPHRPAVDPDGVRPAVGDRAVSHRRRGMAAAAACGAAACRGISLCPAVQPGGQRTAGAAAGAAGYRKGRRSLLCGSAGQDQPSGRGVSRLSAAVSGGRTGPPDRPLSAGAPDAVHGVIPRRDRPAAQPERAERQVSERAGLPQTRGQQQDRSHRDGPADALAVIFAQNIQKEPGNFVLPGSLDAVEKISPRT